MAGVPNNHNGDIVPIITMSNILFLSQKVNKVDRLIWRPLMTRLSVLDMTGEGLVLVMKHPARHDLDSGPQPHISPTHSVLIEFITVSVVLSHLCRKLGNM